MNVADITISNVDEQVKQNFERFCADVGMNMTKGFSALVKVGVTINQQGLLLNPTDEVRRQKRTAALKKLFAEAQENENNLTDEDWEEFGEIRAQSDFDRGVEKWFTP